MISTLPTQRLPRGGSTGRARSRHRLSRHPRRSFRGRGPMDPASSMENACARPGRQRRRDARFPHRCGRRTQRAAHRLHRPSSSAFTHTTPSRIATTRDDRDGRRLTDTRRFAPTRVHLRRNRRSRSPESVFNFSGIRSLRAMMVSVVGASGCEAGIAMVARATAWGAGRVRFQTAMPDTAAIAILARASATALCQGGCRGILPDAGMSSGPEAGGSSSSNRASPMSRRRRFGSRSRHRRRTCHVGVHDNTRGRYAPTCRLGRWSEQRTARVGRWPKSRVAKGGLQRRIPYTCDAVRRTSVLPAMAGEASVISPMMFLPSNS